MKKILAADIGGTNSRFAYFQSDEDGALSLVDRLWLPTRQADSFAELFRQFRESSFPLSGEDADITVLAVAGPVEGGVFSAPPYIPWDIDLERDTAENFAAPVKMINDFVAQAYACRSPIAETAQPILSGTAVSGSTIAVLGAGTALGKALLLPGETGGFQAIPSEGGHSLFPFSSLEEFSFQQFLRAKTGQQQITENLVVSGGGLRYLHWFLSGEELAPEEVPARLIPGSVSLAWAARFYGRVCRDFVLETLAQGGLYIAGGVAARTPALVSHSAFQRAFRDSPTMGRVLANIPVFLLDNQDSGLWGAALYGRQLLHPVAVR